MPALCLKSLTPRCGVVPLPAGPLLSVPGWALAEATNSFRELGARLGRAVRKSWLLASNSTGCRSLCGSKGMRVNSTGFTDSVVETVTRKVWPSPPLCTTSAPATLPPAPPRLSMTSGWPSAWPSGCWSNRAMTSASPPEGKATPRRTGFVGHDGVWAATPVMPKRVLHPVNEAASIAMARRRGRWYMRSLLAKGWGWAASAVICGPAPRGAWARRSTGRPPGGQGGKPAPDGRRSRLRTVVPRTGSGGQGTPSAGCGSWRQPQCLQPLAQCLALGVAQRGLAQRAKRRAGICAAAQFARGAQQAIEAAAAARMRIAVAFDQTATAQQFEGQRAVVRQHLLHLGQPGLEMAKLLGVAAAAAAPAPQAGHQVQLQM